MDFEVVNTDDGDRILIVIGEFTYNDDLSEFSKAIREHHPSVISFNSPGGNPLTAIKYGRRIRALGLSTFQVRKLDCMSACALAFLGGVERIAEPGSIGVHQSSFTDIEGLSNADAVAAVQALTANIISYITEMGVSSDLLQLSLSVGKDDIRFLTGQEMQNYSVTSLFPSSDKEDFSTKPSTTIVKPSQKPEISIRSRAFEFIKSYHHAWSQDNETALYFMQNAYAQRVNFYGKEVSILEIMKDKRRFADRWPERLYQIREETLSINCRRNCSLSAVVVWYARSRQRNATSSGEATFQINWNAESGKIYSETGKVIAIDRKSGFPAHLINLWQQQNSVCRGSSDKRKYTIACRNRDEISKKLARVNWCYGREGEYGYQHRWHICGARSLR